MSFDSGIFSCEWILVLTSAGEVLESKLAQDADFARDFFTARLPE